MLMYLESLCELLWHNTIKYIYILCSEWSQPGLYSLDNNY